MGETTLSTRLSQVQKVGNPHLSTQLGQVEVVEFPTLLHLALASTKDRKSLLLLDLALLNTRHGRQKRPQVMESRPIAPAMMEACKINSKKKNKKEGDV